MPEVWMDLKNSWKRLLLDMVGDLIVKFHVKQLKIISYLVS